MKPRDPSNRPSPPSPAEPPAPPRGDAPRRSGRVQFDSRGQAVWEWAVRTGKFDRNASTQRIRALVETPLSLSEEPEAPAGPGEPTAAAAQAGPGRATPPSASPSLRPASGNPYEPADAPVTLRPGESAGFDPYGHGPSRPRGGR